MESILGSGGGASAMQYDSMAGAKMASIPTLKQRLELAVKQAEQRLEAAKRAREILNANPQLEELLNIMQHGHF